MKKKRQYLLVDDDTTSNLICELNIKKIDPEAEIRSFNVPEEALSCVKDVCVPNKEALCILFLDINMPSMTGWEFLDEFKRFCPEIRSKFVVYILTSSIEDFTTEKKKYSCVRDFLTKPLMRGKLEKVIEDVSELMPEKTEV
ncbi:response regulator [Salinimicrobium soli]|uniref:response regulator n=1 Tax=Salinimicrobium soli TaxID=1254399 RepID=UPI003AAC8BEB